MYCIIYLEVNMSDFMFKVPQELIFGYNSLEKLPSILSKESIDSVMLISDRGLEKIGVVKKVSDILMSAGVRVTEFLDVLPDPATEVVDAAVAVYKDCQAQALVALGGGSPMDVAKAVGVQARYGGSITEYEGADKVPGEIVPIIAIPTTAGTGSEVTPFSVITDTSRNYKLTVYSYKILPHFAILDPQLIMTAPAGIAAACGIDAMIHAWEAYTSLWSNPFSDAMAEKALELIGRSIRRFVATRSDLDAASDMMTGSNFAGLAFAWARLGNVHAMSHPVSAYFHVPHGVANAILLPTIVEYNALADNGRYEKIYNYIHQGRQDRPFVPSMLADEARSLLAELSLPASLSEVGVTEDLFEKMADDAMASGNIKVNPRQTTRKDVIELYRKAF